MLNGSILPLYSHAAPSCCNGYFSLSFPNNKHLASHNSNLKSHNLQQPTTYLAYDSHIAHTSDISAIMPGIRNSPSPAPPAHPRSSRNIIMPNLPESCPRGHHREPRVWERACCHSCTVSHPPIKCSICHMRICDYYDEWYANPHGRADPFGYTHEAAPTPNELTLTNGTTNGNTNGHTNGTMNGTNGYH